MKKTILVVPLALVIVIAACTTWHQSPSFGVESRTEPFATVDTAADFQGTLLAVSDADMKAEGYVTGKVGRPVGQRDALTIFPGLSQGNVRSGEIFASNSVMGWPQIIEVSPDGRFAYVVEIRSEFPSDVEAYDDLFYDSPSGSRLTVFDITDPLNPRVTAEVEAGLNPASVSLTADGRFLLTSSDTSGEEIVIFELEDGIPTQRHTFPYDLPLPDTGAKAEGIRAAIFHPSGEYIAATISDHQIVFLRVIYDSEGIPKQVEKHGNSIDKYIDLKGTALSSGEFTKDGRFFLVPDIGWGHQTPQHFLFSKRGTLISIEFDEGGDHRVVDEERVGWHPEGFALSHDNRLVATVNMERTSVAGTFPGGLIGRRTSFSSLSLMTFDPATGQLEKTDEQKFRGILPEDVVFDLDNDTLAITVYQLMEFEPENGFVEFWDIKDSTGRPKLVPTGTALRVTRGVHDLDVSP